MKILKSDKLAIIVKLAVSAAILFFIFRIIGLEKAYSELANANIFYIFVSFAFVFLAILLKSLRWKNIAWLFKAPMSIKESLNYTYISLAFGMVTPGRLGEFIKAKYLNDCSKIGIIKSLITVTLDKLFDVAALIGFALIGLSFFDFGIPVPPIFFMILLVLYFVFLSAFFFYPEKLVMAAKFFIPEKYKNKLNFFSEFDRYHLYSFCFSAVIWIFFSFSAFFILKSLGISNTPLLVIIVAVPLMALSSLIPISLGGIGVREAVAISLFLAIGMAVEKSLVFSLIYTFNGFIVPAIIGTFLYLKLKR
ncbi:MAG: lysylphosphatidylglycerol synthase transmembrane domain-containing protein [Nanoarchaeota archaeon]